MAENKTKATAVKVQTFLDGVADKQMRDDSYTLIQLMKSITGEEATMWGPSMIGFGTCHYVYASGCEGDIFRTGFSPRKNALTIYLSCGCTDKLAKPLARLGKAKTSKGCLYIKRLSDIDLNVLRELLELGLTLLTDMAKPMANPDMKSKPAKKSATSSNPPPNS